MNTLNGRGYDFRNMAEKDVVRDFKYKMTYVALDFDHEMKAASESSSLE